MGGGALFTSHISRMPGAAMSLSFAEDHGKVGDSHHPYLFVSLLWWLGCWGWATPSSPSQNIKGRPVTTKLLTERTQPENRPEMGKGVENDTCLTLHSHLARSGCL